MGTSKVGQNGGMKYNPRRRWDNTRGGIGQVRQLFLAVAELARVRAPSGLPEVLATSATKSASPKGKAGENQRGEIPGERMSALTNGSRKLRIDRIRMG